MGDTITIDNKALYRMRRLLLNYHNTFMNDVSDPITNEPYIFREMKNIGENTQASVPETVVTTDNYNIDLFNRFIDCIVNFKLSNNVENYDRLLKIKKSNASAEINVGVVQHIFCCMNIVNVFVDILEAYKYWIDNDTNFKANIKNITKIQCIVKWRRKFMLILRSCFSSSISKEC